MYTLSTIPVGKVQMYKYMKQHLSSYSVPQICRQLNVSISGYYG
jgi:hypothetical protein